MNPRHEWLTAAKLKRLARNTLAGAAIAAVAFTMIPAGSALADPADPPRTVAEAQELVDELKQQSAALDQDWLAAQEKYQAAEKARKAKERDLAAQQEEVEELREAVAAIALTQYQNRGVDNTTKLIVSSSPDALLNDLALQGRINERQRVILQDYQTELGNLSALGRSAKADAAAMKQATEEMDKARKASQAKLDEAEEVLDRLTAEERARIEAARRAAEEAARRAAEDNNNDNSQSRETNPNSRNNERKAKEDKPKPPPVPSSGRGAAAVASAQSKLGAPYVWGGTGPGYDCSGLTSTSWRAAGVSLPRTSQAQYSSTKRISRGELQPGDLVFYYRGITHVAIYVGNGQIIHAPSTGSVVQYASMDSMPIAGYGRP